MRSLKCLLLVSCLAGCANPGTGTTASSTPEAAPATVIGTPAPGSKFARIKVGVGKREIQDLIGPPTDQSSHNTGKVYIPFYTGSDTTEIEAHYKGEGILTYASRQVGDTSYELIQIKVDPQEPGYVR